VKRLVLVGGGHAHVEVLRSLRVRPLAQTEVVLVSSGRHTAYSGMVPGFLAGHYRASDMLFDLDALARSCGGRFVDAAVESVDGAGGRVQFDGTQLDFDACSVDIGSAPAGGEVAGMQEFSIPLRPMSNVLALSGRIEELPPGEGSPSINVIGGGAAGVEIALAISQRSRGRAHVVLVHDESQLLPHYPARARDLAERACRRNGVALVLGASVLEVQRDGVRLSNGTRLASVMTIWVAGAAPPPLLAASKLPLSSDGFFLVDQTLRAFDGSPVWGAGDCVSLRDHPWVPKAGVYAVREGPILASNLRAYISARGKQQTYVPQREFLSLLSTGPRSAILSWHGLAVETSWAHTLKRFIDNRFMRRYDVPSVGRK
jgi:selenide,water dikinase